LPIAASLGHQAFPGYEALQRRKHFGLCALQSIRWDPPLDYSLQSVFCRRMPRQISKDFVIDRHFNCPAERLISGSQSMHSNQYAMKKMRAFSPESNLEEDKIVRRYFSA